EERERGREWKRDGVSFVSWWCSAVVLVMCRFVLVLPCSSSVGYVLVCVGVCCRGAAVLVVCWCVVVVLCSSVGYVLGCVGVCWLCVGVCWCCRGAAVFCVPVFCVLCSC